MRTRHCAIALYLIFIGLPPGFPAAAAEEASAQTIEVRLNKNTLRIPETYFLPRFRGRLGPSTERHTIYLGFQFPDGPALSDDYDEHLGASSADALARWNGSGQVAVEIILTSPQRKSRDRWVGNFTSSKPPNAVITRFADAGLEGRQIGSFSLDGETRYVEIFRSIDGAQYFRCENKFQRVERSCGTQLYRDDELRIEVLFLETALPNWKAILSKTVDLVNGWRANPAAR